MKTIQFDNGTTAHAVEVAAHADALETAKALGFDQPRPVIFLSGGASAMTDDDMTRADAIISNAIAQFAAQHNVVVIDGGTEAGIMRMMGRARKAHHNAFPLIGCAPASKVTYPGGPPASDERTALEKNHSHFVLVEGDYWGIESDLIVGLARAISREGQPASGVLINGGKIAQYDVYIASARGEKAIPVVVVDGSGRTADMIATASKTGKFATAMMRAIIEGGRIEVITLGEGPDGMLKKLNSFFGKPPQ